MPHVFELNDFTFEMPMVVDVAEGTRTVKDLLAKEVTPAVPTREQLVPLLQAALGPPPGLGLMEMAEAVDRDRTDGRIGMERPHVSWRIRRRHSLGASIASGANRDGTQWTSGSGLVQVQSLTGFALHHEKSAGELHAKLCEFAWPRELALSGPRHPTS
jgi:hypothetical protein